MKNKILVIEDDAVLRDVLATKLRAQMYDVTVAVDGEEGLEAMKEVKPDLILLDILMPRMNGIEVLEAMNKEKELVSIPTIVLSDSGQPVEVNRARELGARDFIIKAVFDPSEVIDKVDKLLAEAIENSIRSDNSSTGSDVSESEKGSVTPHGKVLVVEDDRFLRELMVRKLSAEGFDVQAAMDAKEFYEILSSKFAPDIILLDLILPEVNGFEILGSIKKDEKYKDIPVIVVSNLGQKQDVERALSLGASDFLVKANFTLDEIIDRVLATLKTQGVS